MYTKVSKLLNKDIKIDTLITSVKYFKSRHNIPITKRVSLHRHYGQRPC